MPKRSSTKNAAGGRKRAQKIAAAQVRSQVPLTNFHSDSFWGAFLLLAVVVAYAPIWQAGFVWDDDIILTRNPCIVGPLGLKEIWTTSAADICPLTITTFWIEHLLWGSNPFPYHLVNVLWHGACAVVLWLVLRELRTRGAWLGAALWAMHPVQVGSVGWVTEMKNTESTLFFLLSILSFLAWLNSKTGFQHPATVSSPIVDRAGGRMASSYALCLLFGALAMASKSSTVILPIVLLLCAWWVEGRWRRRRIVTVIPLLVMSIAASAVAIWTQGFQLTRVADPQWARTWPERIAGAGDAFWFYLGKLIWPYPLVAIYPRWNINATDWSSYLPFLLAATLLLFCAGWLCKRPGGSSRASFFALAYFIVALLPILGLIDNYVFSYSLVFDHFQYLASMGPLALAGAALGSIWKIRAEGQAMPNAKWLCPAVCAGWLLILGVLSWQRASVYKSQETLWTDTVAKNPHSWVGQGNLGLSYFEKGQTDEAVKHMRAALEINPSFAEARSNLAMVLAQNGRLQEAIAEYQKALMTDPRSADAHYNLGNALLQNGQPDDAIIQYQKAFEINPNFAQAHNNLGNALLRKDQIDEATKQYQIALKINPNYPEARGNLGLMLFHDGQLDQAIVQFKEALRLDPTLAPIREYLAEAEAFKQDANQ